MISLLVSLIIFCIIGGLIYWLVTLLPLPEPFKTIIVVAVILIFILILVGYLFGGVELPALRRFG